MKIKTLLMPIIIKKEIANNTMYIVQEFYILLLSFKVTLWMILFSSIFSLHSSTNLLISSFLYLQLLWSKFCLMPHDLSHSHSHTLGFQIKSFITFIFVNQFFNSHLHLSLFQSCLLLQTFASNLHLRLQALWHSICLV